MKKIQSPIRNISWLLLILANTAFAQILKQKDSYTVYINYPDYTIKTSVSNSAKKFNANESLTYYWYASNKIIQTKGDYDGKLVDGSYTSFYLSNNLKEKGNFKKGLKNGKWISWYENGKIDEITNWKKGRKSGQYKKFNSDESIHLTSNYRNDRLNGIRTIYGDGEVTSQTKFRNGKEIIKKHPPQTEKKDSIGQTNSPTKEKFILFKKNKNKDTGVDNTKPTTPKKTWKEKKDSLFEKKEKKPAPINTAPEPTKTTKDANASGSETELQKKSKRRKSDT